MLNLNLNTKLVAKRALRPPNYSYLDTWHKGVDSITFAESINNLPAKFLPRVADLNGTDDSFLINNSAGLNNLTEFTIRIKIKLNKIGANQILLDKDVKKFFFITNTNSLSAVVSYSPTGANSVSNETLSLGGIYDLYFKYSESGDRKTHIFINGVEVTYSTHTASVGSAIDDSAKGYQIAARALALFAEMGLYEYKIWDRALTDSEILDCFNGLDIGTSGLLNFTAPTGQGDYEYDLVNGNHATWSGTGLRYDYDLEGLTYPNDNGYSLWQLAANPDIQVPFDINGDPLSLTAGVDIPTGYTKTRDIVAGGSKWNMADALLDMEYGSILQNDTAGIAYASQNEAYGLVFDGIINKSDDTKAIANYFISDVIGNFSTVSGYILNFNNTETLLLQKTTAGTVPSLFETAPSYLSLNTDYRTLVWRNKTLNQFATGAIGTFVVYIQGKNKAITTTEYEVPNLSEMELVNVSGGAGTNPVLDNTYTMSNFINFDNGVGDQVSKINVNDRYISPYDFTVSTGVYSIIDNAKNAIFNRTNATRQTAASRASLFYDANFPFRYQVNEIADPRIYDTFFESAYLDRIFGKVVLDGTDLIRYDEQLNYATQKTGADLTKVTDYCKITSIYP